MMNRIIISLFLFASFAVVLSARPQYTALTGNRCINCHFTSQGGGIRSELGWYSNNESSLIAPETIGLEEIYKALTKTNTFADGLITAGFDSRYLTARMGGPEGSSREYLLMQLAAYVGVSPVEWLDVYGQYNFADTPYQGQQKWSAAAIIKPSFYLPKLKIGFIQPSIGVRYDDHTMLIRQAAGFARSMPIVPPDYAEFGGEIIYEGLKWLSLTAGLYDSKNMSEISVSGIGGAYVPLTDESKMSSLLRVGFTPKFFGHKINSNFGASYFSNSDYNLINYFLHIGLTDKAALLTEFAMSDKNGLRETSNFSAELLYKITEGLVMSVRYETASTDDLSDPKNIMNYSAEQYVIGLSINPLPYIEFRPEYRIYDRANFESYSAQWAAQLHIFY